MKKRNSFILKLVLCLFLGLSIPTYFASPLLCKELVWCEIRGNFDDYIDSCLWCVDQGYLTNADLYDECIHNYFSVEVIEYALNKGYLLDYEQQLKDEGWIPQSFVRSGSTSSSETSSSTTPTADTGTSGNNSTSTVAEPASEPVKTYTEEEIEAAWEEVSRTKSTCVEAGSIKYKNSLTGKTKTEVLELAEHDYQITEEVAATCGNVGEQIYTCSVCGDSYTEEIPMIEHNYEITEQTNATCEEAGKIVYTCSICNSSYEEGIEPTGHTESEMTVVKEAKLFSEGRMESTCTVCGAVLASEVIAQTCPLAWYVVVIILVGACTIILLTLYLVRRHKKKLAKGSQSLSNI